MKSDRFQHQNVFVKFWRFRHYLTIPFVALNIYYYEHTRKLEDVNDWRMSFKNSWGLATGLAQSKMKWYWFSTELNYDFSLKEEDE